MCRFHEDLARQVATLATADLNKAEVIAVAQVALTQDRVQMHIPALNGIDGYQPGPLMTLEVKSQLAASGLPVDLMEINAYVEASLPILAATIAHVFEEQEITSGSLGLPGCSKSRAKMLDEAAMCFFDGSSFKALTIKEAAPEPRFERLFPPVKALLEDAATRQLLHDLFDGSVSRIVLGAPAELAAMQQVGIDPNSIGGHCCMKGPETPGVA